MERSYRSLIVGVVIVFVDNLRLIDNSRELVDNVRDKLYLIDKSYKIMCGFVDN